MEEFVTRDIKLETSLMSARIFWARLVNSEKDTWMTDKAKHSFWEIQLALDGEIEMQTDSDRTIVVSKKFFTVIPPNEYHYVSKRFNLSERHINRLLEESNKENLHKIINHEKLKLIEDLLTTTDLSMNEIASIC